MFIGRETELTELNRMYEQDQFHMFVLYGRRRVGKTTLLNEFGREKDTIFFAAEQSSEKLNLEKFSALVFEHYHETALEPFSSWTNALTYICDRQTGRRLLLILDEFPYLARKNKAMLSELQHLIDHRLRDSRLFLVLCGSYMGFIENEILSAKSPLFGRRTAQLKMKPLNYLVSLRFCDGFSPEEQLMLYGAYGGTPMYLEQISAERSFSENIQESFLKITSYLYEEPLFLLRQEVQEPGIYSAVIEAIAGGASKANEISTKIGEESAKCLKYIRTLCELGILYKETPFGEKESSRKSIYGISDLMFRFWYRYVFGNRILIETGAAQAVWNRRIAPDLSHYMGHVFERICREYLLAENSLGNLPFLFTSIGRWWGTNPRTRCQEEIDLIANDGDEYLFCECKWQSEPADLPIFYELQRKADVFRENRGETWYLLFSKSGFSGRLQKAAHDNSHILLIGLAELI